MAKKPVEPKNQICLPGSSVWYSYTSEMVDTNYGPERYIKLSRDGEWYTGPHVELSECMTENDLVRMAISMLNDN